MGLSLHYRLSAPRACTPAQAAALVRAIHATALGWKKAGRVDRVLPIADEPEELQRWACAWHLMPHPDDPEATTGVEIRPEAGWIFPVLLGEGCQPLWLGLCRYPANVAHGGKKIPTRLGAGWQLAQSCKTQYASLHGWENFARCHVGAIELIRAWRAHGVRAKISDEGGYWPRRSRVTLRRKLDEMNGLVAAFAGALKDEADDAGGEIGGPVASPIFAHPQFERIEAEGAQRAGAKLRAGVRIVATRRKREKPD